MAVIGGVSSMYAKTIVKENTVEFIYRSSETIKSCSLAGSFNNWDKTAAPMENAGDNTWKVTLELQPGEHQYKFVLDDENWETDPDAAEYSQDMYRNAVLRLGGETPKMKLTGKPRRFKKKISYKSTFSEDFSVFEGNDIHYLARDYDKKIAAHILIPAVDTEPQVVAAFPAGEASAAFKTSDSLWELKEMEPFSDGATGQYGIKFRIKSDRKKITLLLKWIVLHNILYIRHVMYYSPTHEDYPRTLKKTGPGNFLLQGSQDTAFIKNLEKLKINAPDLIAGINIDELKQAGHISINLKGRRIFAAKKTYDGKNRYELEIFVPEEFDVSELTDDGELRISGKKNIELIIRASTDFTRPTPMPPEKLLSKEAIAEAGKNKEFSKSVRNYSYLNYEEKALAGSWFYLVHFGRDSLNAFRLMWKILSNDAKRNSIAGVLSRISDDGTVAVVEELNDWPLHCAVREFNGKIIKKDFSAAAEILKEISQGKRSILRVYDVLDATLMLPVVIKDFINDAGREYAGSFMDETNLRGKKNIVSVLKNINRVFILTGVGGGAGQEAKNLIRLIDSAGTVGNWRDSGHGLAWGKYPADMNVSLARSALDAADFIIGYCREILKTEDLIKLAEKNNLTRLAEYLRDAEPASKMKSAAGRWNETKNIFTVHYSADEIRKKLNRYLKEAELPETEKKMLRNIRLNKKIRVADFLEKGKIPEEIKNGITFPAIALDEQGKPLTVMHSDEVYTLLDRDLTQDETEKITDYFFIPYPVGLWSSVGLLITNPVYLEDKNLWGTQKWDGLGRNAYHGSVVWGWQMRALVLGLCRQMRFAIKEKYPATYIKKLKSYLDITLETEKNAGNLTDSELWTWEPVKSGNMKPAAFGAGKTQPSVPVQLWSASSKTITLKDTLVLYNEYITKR